MAINDNHASAKVRTPEQVARIARCTHTHVHTHTRTRTHTHTPVHVWSRWQPSCAAAAGAQTGAAPSPTAGRCPSRRITATCSSAACSHALPTPAPPRVAPLPIPAPGGCGRRDAPIWAMRPATASWAHASPASDGTAATAPGPAGATLRAHEGQVLREPHHQRGHHLRAQGRRCGLPRRAH